jgi:glycosyltransferase involved in cell wall biosynthesis
MDPAAVEISIVVPAHNEEALIGATLLAIDVAARDTGRPFEIIVVDDGSTDRTAEISRGHGARVVSAAVHQIAAARNAGARVARGNLLVFVDADTIVPAAVLRAAVRAVGDGAVGGGAGATFDAGTPRWAQRTIAAVAWILRTARWAAGCFLFVRRDAFERVGGFDERYFASEEIHLSRALKRVGRFVILSEQVVTSGRKAAVYTRSHALWLAVRMLWPGSLKRRDALEFWYSREQRLRTDAAGERDRA